MSMQLSREKVGQAWCTPETAHIPFDPVLAEAFANILEEIWAKPWLGNATTQELLQELLARAQINGYANYKTVNTEYGSSNCTASRTVADI